MNKLNEIRRQQLAKKADEIDLVEKVQTEANRIMDEQAALTQIKQPGTEWFQSPYHDDPCYQRALSQYVASQSSNPFTPMNGLQAFNAGAAEAVIILPMNGGKPTGFLKQGIKEWRLAFRGFDVSLNKQFERSTRPWRDWMHDEFGRAYRSDKEPHPEDWNLRACASSLHGVDDVRCEGKAVIGDVAVLAVWSGESLDELFIIRGTAVTRALVKEQHAQDWSGYRCSVVVR